MVCHERIILLLVALAVSIPAGIKTRQSVQCGALAGFSVMQSPTGFVHVGGDVAHPGMYPLSANIMTEGVIKMATPVHPIKYFAPPAIDVQHIKNGDDVRLRIGTNGRGDVTINPLPASARITMGIPLDINAMGPADFDRLPGIGPVIARRIVDYRQNNGGTMDLKDLRTIKGIGEKKYDLIKKYF